MKTIRSLIYCPVCATGRALPQHKMPWFRIYLSSGVWGFLIGSTTILTVGWWFGVWATLISAVLCFSVLEVYYTMRFKRELVCPVCHFDPVLYRKSPERAKERCLKNLKMQEDLFVAKWQLLKNSALEA